MAYRRVLAVLTVIGMLVCAVPLGLQEDSMDSYAANNGGLLLYEISYNTTITDGDKKITINPSVTLINTSEKSINLKNYAITDGEGTITFEESLSIAPHATVTVTNGNNTHRYLENNSPLYKVGSNGIKVTNSFNLSNSGDDIYLKDSSGNILDAVCYGNKTISDTKVWIGDSVSKANNSVIKRVNVTDTDTAKDWIPYESMGLVFNPDEQFDATVTPFLFPNDGGVPIYDALDDATKSVFITMYQLSSKNIYAKLIELEKRHVDVTVLIDGGSLGWSGMSRDLGYMMKLQEAGGEIRLIDGTAYDRYSYVHAKYCIIDMEKTIITSENWTGDNCNGSIIEETSKIYSTSGKGNRGWGAVIESTGYAEYMKKIFDNDYSMDYGDVRTLDEFSKGVKITDPGIMTYIEPSHSKTFSSYNAKVTPMVSYDTSLAAETYYMENATYRVYTEQQSLSSSYYGLDGSVLTAKGPLKSLTDASKKEGIDVRFILSEGVSSSDKKDAVAIVEAINSQTLVKSASMDKPYLHNKGLICDDVTIVTSVNWTPTSFEKNRESGVVIHSKEIADYYAAAYEQDFNRYYSGGEPTVIMDEKTDAGKKIYSFTVKAPSTAEKFHWDFGNGITRDTTVSRVALELESGEYTVNVTITLSDETTMNVTNSFVISESGGDEKTTDVSETMNKITELFGDYGEYIIPIIVIIIGIVVAVIRKL